MGDRYFFSGQFRCMNCGKDYDAERMLGLAWGDDINLKCDKCGAITKFWLDIDLRKKLIKRGKLKVEKTKKLIQKG